MTNTVVVNSRTYMYEMFWRDSKKSKITDSKNILFPYPVDKTKNSEWVYDNVYKMFIKRLVTVQNSYKKTRDSDYIKRFRIVADEALLDSVSPSK